MNHLLFFFFLPVLHNIQDSKTRVHLEVVQKCKTAQIVFYKMSGWSGYKTEPESFPLPYWKFLIYQLFCKWQPSNHVDVLVMVTIETLLNQEDDHLRHCDYRLSLPSLPTSIITVTYCFLSFVSLSTGIKQTKWSHTKGNFY